MKFASLVLASAFICSPVIALETTKGQCYAGGVLQLHFVITTKIDKNNYEMFSNLDGTHAILKTRGTYKYGPGVLPGVLIKRTGSQVVTLKNGFDGVVEIWEECTGKEEGNAELLRALNSNFATSSKSNPKNLETLEGDTEFNKCTSKCHSKFSDDKVNANTCYAECEKKR